MPAFPLPARVVRRATAVAAVAVAAVVLATGCSATTNAADAPSAASSSDISAARCAQNKAAGTITYVTGYQYQASVTILDVVAAQSLGYFTDLCLDVKLQPGTGDTSQNAQLVAAGTAQLSSLSGQSDAVQNLANGVKVKAIATFGHVPIATLITEKSVTSLKQLDGTTLGQKGSLPPAIEAMLTKAGADVSSIKQVKVGYDPSVLTRGQVQSLTGYKSNEPLTLKAQGDTVKEWNPEDYGVPGSIATVIANPAFASKHRTAVADFLRAELHAYAHCETSATDCVAAAAKVSAAGYDKAHNAQVWKTESALTDSSLPAGEDLGTITVPSVKAEATFLLGMKQIKAVPDLSTAVDDSFISSIYKDGSLVWPAP